MEQIYECLREFRRLNPSADEPETLRRVLEMIELYQSLRDIELSSDPKERNRQVRVLATLNTLSRDLSLGRLDFSTSALLYPPTLW